jgi:hypothetical protein
MRRFALPVAAALLGACAAGGRERAAVEVAPWADPGSYRRIGVLPFTEPGGRGRHLAEIVSAKLREQGRQTSDVAALEKSFGAIKPDSLGFTMTQLEDLKRETGAQAILFGEVGAESLSLILLDLQSGEEALKARFGPRAGGYPEEEILRLALESLRTRTPR